MNPPSIEKKRRKIAKPIDLSTRWALRVSEVARLIGVSSGTVRALIARGELPGRNVGQRGTACYVVPVEGLRAWLAGSKAGPPEATAE